MVKWLIGDLLTGKRIQTLQVLSGSWSEVLNRAGDISCTATLKDPVVARLGLRESAMPGKAFLAAVEGDTVLQAGPIWAHDWDANTRHLTLTGAGMWSYFDHRVLLPLLAGRLPSDPTVTTRFTDASVDPDDVWPTDTRTSLQGIARALVAQAQSWTGGNVPVILPTEVTGTAERTYKGADLAFVGERLKQLTQVLGGPDIMFTPRFNTARDGIEWVMRIGTPTVPLLSSLQEVVFNVGLRESSVTNLKVNVDGSRIGSQAFGAGGRQSDEVLTTVSTDSTLTDAGFPLLEVVDSSHSTVNMAGTLQEYSDELVLRGRKPIQTWSFDHAVASRPFLGAFNAGDFARVKVTGDPYIEDGSYRLRVLSRSGDAVGKKVHLEFQPEVL